MLHPVCRTINGETWDSLKIAVCRCACFCPSVCRGVTLHSRPTCQGCLGAERQVVHVAIPDTCRAWVLVAESKPDSFTVLAAADDVGQNTWELW